MAPPGLFGRGQATDDRDWLAVASTTLLAAALAVRVLLPLLTSAALLAAALAAASALLLVLLPLLAGATLAATLLAAALSTLATLPLALLIVLILVHWYLLQARHEPR